MYKFIFLAFCLISCATPTQKTTKDNNLVLFCNIFTMEGKLLRRDPGGMCAYEDDGHLLMSNTQNNELAFYNQRMQSLWKLPLHIHHQINKDSVGNFLVLTSESKIYREIKTRFDRLVKINKEGQIIGHFSFYEHQGELLEFLNKKRFNFYNYNWDKENLNLGTSEISHANSFYEIQKNAKSDLYPELKAGNFFVNINILNLFIILDPTMTKIIKMIDRPSETDLMHDAQITKDGDILLYNNLISEIHPSHSELQLYSYPDLKMKWSYTRKTDNFNYPYCGSLQLLGNDQMLFTDIRDTFSKAILLDMKSNQELKIINPEGWEKQGTQQIKMQDLSGFLKNNKGI